MWFNGSELRFISNERFRKIYDIPTRKKSEVKFTTNKNVETTIKYLSVQQGLNQQKYVLREKVANKVGIPIRKMSVRIYESEIDSLNKRNRKLLIKGKKVKINTSITLSRKGIAERFGRVSKSTGTRQIKKMLALGLITDTTTFIFIRKATKEFVRKARMLNHQSNLVFKNGWMAMQLTNQITPLSD